MKTTLCVCLLTMSAAFAQTPAPAEKPQKFELADVHISKTAPGFVQSFGGQFHKGRYVNRENTMLQLIAEAYGVATDVISGGPGWVSSDLFDIVAKVPDGTTRAQANLMLQSLLAERFGLVMKKGNNPVSRYVVTVAKGGSKLKPASGDESGCKPEQQQGGNPNDPASIPDIKLHCRNMSAKDIAETLRQFAGAYFDRDVVDQTKLEGSWNADVEWTPRFALAAKGADGISVFTAMEKQLGLKAELGDVSLPSFAIEHVNRTPSPNPPDAVTALSEAPPRFEAATIKPADPSAPPFQGLLYTGGSQMHGGGTLNTLIAMSLQIPVNTANDMIIGVPKSVSDQRWDILAKVPATGEGAPTVINGRPTPPPFSVALQMVYGMLVEQFQLKTHEENREVTVYALTVPAGGKSKMTPAAESERAGCKPDPNAPTPAANIQFMLSCKNYSMADIARDLQQRGGAYIDHPVVDATGVTGGWNFLIGWTPKQALQQSAQAAATAAANGGEGAAADPGGITLFEAVEKQLGLKLVKQKRTIPVIVVDHVSEKPVE